MSQHFARGSPEILAFVNAWIERESGGNNSNSNYDGGNSEQPT